MNDHWEIHPTACVEEDVILGQGTKVWRFCHIREGVRIGSNCSFGQNCVVGPEVRIGNGVKVQNNVSLFQGLEVEDDVFIGPSAVFTNILNPRSFISRKTEFKTTRLERGCTIGANATILCGLTVGRYAMIGAGAVVTHNAAPHTLMLGAPARPCGWVSLTGNRLSFDGTGLAVDEEDGTHYRLTDSRLEVVHG